MAVGFASGDAVMVLQDGQRKRGRFVEEVKEGYEVALRHDSGKRYLSPQVFERDLVSTPTAEDLDALADFAQKNATLDFSRVGERQTQATTTEGEGE